MIPSSLDSPFNPHDGSRVVRLAPYAVQSICPIRVFLVQALHILGLDSIDRTLVVVNIQLKVIQEIAIQFMVSHFLLEFYCSFGLLAFQQPHQALPHC